MGKKREIYEAFLVEFYGKERRETWVGKYSSFEEALKESKKRRKIWIKGSGISKIEQIINNHLLPITIYIKEKHHQGRKLRRIYSEEKNSSKK